jgi:hypothetical protein
MRGEYRRFQRRLPRAYSRFDDGHPGRRQIGSRGWADGDVTRITDLPFGQITRRPPKAHTGTQVNGEAEQAGGALPEASIALP